MVILKGEGGRSSFLKLRQFRGGGLFFMNFGLQYININSNSKKHSRHKKAMMLNV